MFVDFKSPEISQMLNQRYLDNFNAQNALQDQLSALQAAPFEGDQKMRASLISEIQGQIESLSNRGDYENLTLPVTQLAQTYKQKSAPIAQNAAAYQAYKNQLDEDYKEGRLKYDDYQGTLALASKEYTGLTTEADGTVGNYFKGLPAVYDPKIEDRMKDALEGIVAEEYGNDSKIVGVNSANGILTVQTKDGIKEVSNQRVQGVMDMIMSSGDVVAYLDRKAKINTAFLSADTLQEKKNTALQNMQTALSSYQTALGDVKNPEQRQQIESIIAGIIKEAGDLSNLTDPEELRAKFEGEERSKLDNTYRSAATSRYAYTQRETLRHEEYAPEWVNEANSAGLASKSIYTAVPGVLTEMINPEGVTVGALSGSITNYQEQLNKYEDPNFMADTYGISITGTELLQMNEEQFKSSFPGYDISMFRKAKQAVSTTKAMKIATERGLQEAKAVTGIDQTKFLAEVKNSVPAAAEATSMIAKEFGVDEEKALELFSAYARFVRESGVDEGFGGLAPAQLLEDILPVNKLLTSETRLNHLATAENNPLGEEVFNKINSLFPKGYIGSKKIERVAARLAGIESNYEEDLNDYLEENKSVVTSTPVFTDIPVYMTKAEKTSFYEAFKPGQAPVDAFGYLDAQGKSRSFQEAVESVSAIQPSAEDFDIPTAQLAQIRMAPYNLSGTGGTFQMTYKDKDNRNVTVAVPMTNVKNPGIERYLSSPYATFADMVGAQHARGVNDIRVPYYGADGTRYEMKVNFNDSGANTVTILDSDGSAAAVYDFNTVLSPTNSEGVPTPIARIIANGGRIAYE